MSKTRSKRFLVFLCAKLVGIAGLIAGLVAALWLLFTLGWFGVVYDWMWTTFLLPLLKQWVFVWLPALGTAVFLLSRRVRRADKFRFVAILLGLMIGGMASEPLAWIFLRNNPLYERFRQQMMDSTIPINHLYKSVGQPYLLYVPAPNLRVGKNYHNEQGYRGKAVELERSPGVARVVCFGGSTTYGIFAEDPQDSYPAQLEIILNQSRPADVRSVEVINAGLPNATTAELLTHYHFKFQYYRPDLVIVNTGGNDAVTAVRSTYYQPDYSHLRSQTARPTPLSKGCRFLMKSRLFSLALVQLLYGPQKTISDVVDESKIDKPPAIVWHPVARKPGLVHSLPDSELGFTRNLRRLIDMLGDDGVKIVLVPFRIAPGGDHLQAPVQGARNERIMKRIASENDLTVAPFPVEVIGPKNWVDSCHVNEAGCREKAEHIAPYARRVLWPDSTVKPPPL